MPNHLSRQRRLLSQLSQYEARRGAVENRIRVMTTTVEKLREEQYALETAIEQTSRQVTMLDSLSTTYTTTTPR